MAIATGVARRWPVLLIAAVGGLANLLYRVRGDVQGSDYREVWLAGRMWRVGGNPYDSADFYAAGFRLLGPHYPHMWPYPPHIWWLSIPFSLPGVALSLLLWNLLGIVLSAVSAALLAITFGRTVQERAAIGFGIFAYVGLMTASGSALGVGQTGFLVLFGLALLAWGIARERILVSALAMAVLMLKPQVGLIACAAVLPTRGGIRAVAWAVALVAVGSLPALAIEGLRPTIDGYLANLALYRTIPYDLPIAMTGLGNLVAVAGGPDLPAIGMSLAGAVLGLLLLVALRRRAGGGDSRTDREGRVEEAGHYLLAAIAAMLGLAFLHIYDLVLAAPLIALLPRLGGWSRGLVLAGLLALSRPENIGRLLHLPEPASAAIASIGCLMVLAAAFVALAGVGQARIV